MQTNVFSFFKRQNVYCIIQIRFFPQTELPLEQQKFVSMQFRLIGKHSTKVVSDVGLSPVAVC